MRKNGKKARLCTWMLALALVILSVGNGGMVLAETSGGDSLETVPDGYKGIYTAADLKEISKGLDGKYILMNDVDVKDISWMPIGETAEKPFSGTFDGNGHQIQGLYRYNEERYGYAGLFGYLTGTVENLSLTEVRLHGEDEIVGGIAGASTGTIRNCNVKGNLYSNRGAGGICGEVLQEGLIEKCWFNGKIESDNIGGYGGIAGALKDQSSVNTCYNLGCVLAYTVYMASGGGIAGDVYSTAVPAVSNCFNIGAVKASEGGGIAGYSREGYIDSCYSIGLAVGEYSDAVVSTMHEPMHVTNCYFYDTELGNIQNEIKGTKGIALKDLGNRAYYKNLNEDIWAFNGELPYLKELGNPFADYGKTEAFDGGRGLPYDPYRISTKEQLNQIRNYSGSAFILTEDLHFESADFADGGPYYNYNYGWTPIGDDKEGFFGYVDGQGHKITGLRISRPQDLYKGRVAGLFADLVGGYIRNLSVEDCRISAVSGIATGIVGYGGEKSVISRCSFSGTLRGKEVSGIVYSSSGLVEECCSTGRLNGDSAGGISMLFVGPGHMKNCFFDGSIESGVGSGGIVKRASGDVTIENCYALNVANDKNCSGISDEIFGDVTFENCYYYQQRKLTGSNDETLAGQNGLSDSELSQKEAYKGFDFDSVWKIDAEGDRRTPYLQNVTLTDSMGDRDSRFSGGNGTLLRPYVIETAEQLQLVRDDLSAHYRLEQDLDLSCIEKWSPIGTERTKAFSGIFDGNGHTIKGLQLKGTASEVIPQGLFGYVSGKITNLHVVGNASTEAPKEHAGMIACYLIHRGVIYNCSARGTMDIVSDDNNVGGIAGVSESGTLIQECVNYVDISGGQNCGGIAGEADGSIISCTNYGDMKGLTNVGGIVGDGGSRLSLNFGDIEGRSAGGIAGHGTFAIMSSANMGSIKGKKAGGIVSSCSSPIENCMNVGAVYGSEYGGGILGAGQGKLTNCYSIGQVTSEMTGGALIGRNTIRDKIENIFYYSPVETKAIGEGPNETDAKALSLQQMKVQSSFEGFDFENIWRMGTEEEGYPYPVLREMKPDYNETSFVLNEGAISVALDEVHKLDFVIQDVQLKDYIWWYSSNPAAVTVDRQGVIQRIGNGNALITGVSLFSQNEVHCYVTDAKHIGACLVSHESVVSFDEHGVTPEVTLCDGDYVLQEGKDYEISYHNNFNTGSAYVDIQGKGLYSGQFQSAFTIAPLVIKDADVTLSKDSYVYDGKSKKPTVNVTDGKDRVFTEGTDYTVSYDSDCNKTGLHQVTVTFCGNYEGTANASYQVCPSKVTNVKANLYKDYDDIRITWKSVTGATGYRVYWKKGNGNYKYTTVKGKTSLVKKNLTDGSAYTFKVVAYKEDEEKKICGSASKTVKVYTLKKVKINKVKKVSQKKVSVSWKNVPGETGYQISRSAKKNGTANLKCYSGSELSQKTLTVPKGKTYYYKVRAYKVVDGKRIYGPWSKTIAKKV